MTNPRGRLVWVPYRNDRERWSRRGWWTSYLAGVQGSNETAKRGPPVQEPCAGSLHEWESADQGGVPKRDDGDVRTSRTGLSAITAPSAESARTRQK